MWQSICSACRGRSERRTAFMKSPSPAVVFASKPGFPPAGEVMPSLRSITVRAELVEAVFASCVGDVPTSRGLPGGNSLFFCVAKRKVSKRKGDPAVCDPCAALRGNLRCAVQPGSSSNSPSAQTIARPDPDGPPLLGAARRVLGPGAGSDSGTQSGSGEEAQSASSPPRIRIGSLFSHPSGRAEERSRKRIRASDCLSVASSSSTPFSASTAGCPVAQRRGPGPSGRIFFGDFLLATQKKVTCRRATLGMSRKPNAFKINAAAVTSRGSRGHP
jgi:hypothetical protein